MPTACPRLPRHAFVAAVVLAVAACSTSAVTPAPSGSNVALASESPGTTLEPSQLESGLPLASLPEPTPSPLPSPAASSAPGVDIYAATLSGKIQPAWQGYPERVYVPDEQSGTITVIDPATFKVLFTYKVGKLPEHVSPDWDGHALYVENAGSSSLTVIDPTTGKPTGRVISTPYPYNLYFTPDGTEAIVVEDGYRGTPADENGLRFYDRKTWKQIGFLPIPWAGADHLDFTADGSHLILSTEYTGRIVLVDVAHRSIVKSLFVGGSATDVRLSPDGTKVFVANQVRNGVDVLDPTTLQYLKFIKLGNGTHGFAISRDATRLFVTNRLAGTMSVIDIATLQVEATWNIGGSPDMVAESPDGSQLWISDRFTDHITVVSSTDGTVLATIVTGYRPHGLAYWPEPGRYSLGHNGNMR